MVLLMIKVGLHIVLDNSMGYSFTISKNWEYLMPYDKVVDVELERKKRACNQIQKFMMYVLFSFFVFAIINAIK